MGLRRKPHGFEACVADARTENDDHFCVAPVSVELGVDNLTRNEDGISGGQNSPLAIYPLLDTSGDSINL